MDLVLVTPLVFAGRGDFSPPSWGPHGLGEVPRTSPGGGCCAGRGPAHCWTHLPGPPHYLHYTETKQFLRKGTPEWVTLGPVQLTSWIQISLAKGNLLWLSPLALCSRHYQCLCGSDLPLHLGCMEDHTFWPLCHWRGVCDSSSQSSMTEGAVCHLWAKPLRTWGLTLPILG